MGVGVLYFHAQNIKELCSSALLATRRYYAHHLSTYIALGHSRTIIGIEKNRNGNFVLLIFDPSHQGSQLLSCMKDYKLNKLKKSVDTFNREKYQIVYVEEGLWTEQEIALARRIR